jgi:membrane associated rhomboid family serine protease
MRCPECAGQRTQVRTLRTNPDQPTLTYILIGINALVFLGGVFSGGELAAGTGGSSLIADGGLARFYIDQGEYYRLVTSGFLHAGFFHLAVNMFSLYILGTLLEPAIGTARFAGIYAVSVLSGSFLVMVMDPDQLTVGASGGVFGLMAAAFLIARDRGLDELASQIGFFVIINLVLTFSVNNISIGGHIGGLVGGAIAALAVNQIDRRRIPNAKAIEYGVLIALCAVAFVGGIVAAESSVPAALNGR